jgi:cobalt-zinc-cadmium efflux system protein
MAHQHGHDHHDAHDHDHSHDHAPQHDEKKHQGHGHHGHNHAPTSFGRAFLIAIALNTTFVAVEFGYGFAANSTALMADAGHNLSDVLGLILAWGAAILSKKAPSVRYTYGLRSTSILAALANAMFLLVACGAIAWEAIMRFSHPPVVAGLTVTIVAGVGILINGISAWLFVKGSKGDLNIRGAYMHMMADAVVSLGVVVSGLIMIFTGWNWLDPVVSLVITAVIVLGTWGLLRDSVQLALSAVPAHIDVAAVEAYLRQRTGVTAIHDLHIWGMSTTESALTVHLVMPEYYPSDATLDEIAHDLKDKFFIQHSTLQVGQGTTLHRCALQAAAGEHAH